MGIRFCSVLFLFIAHTCCAQQWQVEAMAGVSGYNGDLNHSNLSFKTMGPAINLNLKYSLPGDRVILRTGVNYGRIQGNDKNNSDPILKSRNLSFKTHILEWNAGAELNILSPEYFTAFPYIFAGVGVFHFDPYTFDNNGQKTFLRSLGTEGQGLPEYPGRKMYSLTQFCIPIGAGWKWEISDRYEVSYEIGVRYLFTDYLDDVSTTYVDPQTLQAERGRIAAELAYRGSNGAGTAAGRQRGNPKVKDFYYVSGFKFMVRLNR